jgi:hypothetical protein
MCTLANESTPSFETVDHFSFLGSASETYGPRCVAKIIHLEIPRQTIVRDGC